MQTDSFDVFATPIDSVRVAAQDITSHAVTEKLDFFESIWALRHLIEPLYILLVILLYYIVVKRIPGLKTNTPLKRNAAMFVISVIVGIFQVVLQKTPYLNVLVTGMGMFAFYELIFKGIFHVLEERFKLKLPDAYIDEVVEEKKADIAKVESLRQPNT